MNTFYGDRWTFEAGGKTYKLVRETSYPDIENEPWLSNPALYAAEGESDLFMPSLVSTGVEPMAIPIGHDGITGCLSPEGLPAIYEFAEDRFPVAKARVAYVIGRLLGRVINWLPSIDSLRAVRVPRVQ